MRTHNDTGNYNTDNEYENYNNIEKQNTDIITKTQGPIFFRNNKRLLLTNI